MTVKKRITGTGAPPLAAMNGVFVQQVARYGDGALTYYFLCLLFNFI